MRHLKLFTFLIILISSTFSSCKKDELTKREITKPQTKLKDFGAGTLNETIVLGNQLENPYSVSNMQLAYSNLLQNGVRFQSGFNIYASHLYVRFLPQDERELDLIMQDTTLELYDYPLDYEIVTPGISYHDPLISRTDITWQYCAVKSDYRFPDVRYEIISQLFIPEEIPEFNMTTDASDDVYDLVTEALRITNNLDETENSRWTKWNPSGTITVFDDIENGQIPLMGAKARARRWFTTKTCYTDQNGYFQTGSFRRKVNYSIKWETGEYKIRNGILLQAYFNGPKMRSPWNLDISSGKSLRFATIHRAAYRYHYRDIGGMKRPNVWTTLRICYRDKTGFGINWGTNWQYFIGWGGVIPNIHIYGKNPYNGAYWDTDALFSTTIHELGHASHIELMNADEIQFSQVSIQLRESWANAIEWYITQIEYVELDFANYDDPTIFNFGDHMQWWDETEDHDYTPLFIDLVDTYNQSRNRGTQPTIRCPDGGTFDGVNCRIGSPPAGENAYIYADHFYHTPVGCCDCPQEGTFFDGANCFVIDIPDNSIGFIWNNSWYLFPAGNTDFPYDQISGYTMGALESNVVKYSYGLTSLRTKLKANKPSNMTDKHIDVYLNFFFNL